MKINVVIPSLLSYKSQKMLCECLASLLKNSRDVTFHIVITTNAVQLYMIPSFVKYKKNIKVIRNTPQVGFSEMNNVAINYLMAHNSDYFLFLNDDVWLSSNFWSEFKEHTKRSDIVVPLIMEADRKKIDSFGVEYFTSGYAKDSKKFENETTLATAACLLVKTVFLKKMRNNYGYYFNPILHFYLEDVDFSLRAFLSNAKIVKNKKMVCFHRGSSTSGKRSRFTMYQTYRNIIWVILMNWPARDILKYLPSILLVQSWVILYSTYHFGPLLYISALLSTIKNSPKLWKYRKRNLTFGGREVFEKVFSKYAFRTYHEKVIKTTILF